MTLPKIPVGVGFPLYKGVEYINDAIEAADKAQQDSSSAKATSENAVSTANAAETKADSVQEQFNQVVIEGDSSVEAAQARVDAEGNSFTTLKERLDNGDSLLSGRASHPFQYGYTTDVSKLDTLEKVQANWQKLKNFINDTKYSKNAVRFGRLRTLNDVYAEWISGRNCPVGFYSDSTTDGAKTTGHISSTSDYAAFKVNVNESPNAYPKKLEEFIAKLNNTLTSVRCYNGGFDGESYRSGFGLDHWYNVWFRGLAGSNVDFSDVKMIVLGFGTSDSINLNDTASVIDNYSIDLECTIIDCFLRGVQPVIQSPVINTMRVGRTVEYRDSEESVTIIETVQKSLCKKYNLEYLSYSEPWQKALSNFSGLKYLDLMADDMVHPVDMGHRLHASYLASMFNPNIAKLKEEKSINHVFAGHPAYITLPDEIIAPASRGGTILKKIDPAYIADDSYQYHWLSSEGNSKSSGELLVKLPVYVEKPTVLYITEIKNAETDNRYVTVESLLLNEAKTKPLVNDAYQQPETEFYSHKTPVTFLPYGLNIITLVANGNTTEQKFNSFYLASVEEHFNFELGRGTSSGGPPYATKMLTYPSVISNYFKKPGRTKDKISKYYNILDNTDLDISFELISDLNTTTTHQIFSHYNDVKGYQDSYNLIEITNDLVEIKTKDSVGTTTIHSQTITGLNALLKKGVHVNVRFTPRFYNNEGVQVQLLIDDVVKLSSTALIGEMWSDGYGFDAPNIKCKDITITSRRPIQGFVDLDKVL
jgi:hypothetical protein